MMTKNLKRRSTESLTFRLNALHNAIEELQAPAADAKVDAARAELRIRYGSEKIRIQRILRTR